MKNNVKLTTDAGGMHNLILSGEWNNDVERGIETGEWNIISLFQVEWKDYTPLKKYAEKIYWIRVPFGPDKTDGFNDLKNLRVIQLYDSPKPSIDFRPFEFLERLEAPWDKKNPEYLANKHVGELVIQNVGGEDLMWIASMQSLLSLTIKGGKITSLHGIERLGALRELRIDDLKKCMSLTEVCQLHALERLSVDAPSAILKNINWISSMPKLKEISLDCLIENLDWEILGSHPALQRVSMVYGGNTALSDDDVIKLLSSAGRKIQSFSRSLGKSPVFSVSFY